MTQSHTKTDIYSIYFHLKSMAEDRGSADAYYNRPWNPHMFANGKRVTIESLTPQEIVDYTRGYNNEESRKDWG